jgi:alkanesulfonate monooxygenase SsuD/methylene tetrahydromethanopterin reductase-like flavin-dependent oxidoreductase (luciferase family)
MRIGFALSPTWLRGNAWRRADSDVEQMFSLGSYSAIARAAESAGVDFLFAPDAGYLDTRGIGAAPGFSTLDSHTLVSALATVTERVQLVPTVQTAFASPYTTARQLQSLHQLSGGRAGWNAVTALGGHENFGLTELPESPARYAKAAEFVRVVHELWKSYPAEALVMNRETGLFADELAVQRIDFDGDYFRVQGPISTPAHPGRRPPLFQAGASRAGIEFAGATADAVFGCASHPEQAETQRSALRDAAVRSGRKPDDVNFFPGLNFVLAESRQEAEELMGSPRAVGPQHWTVIGTPEEAVRSIHQWRDAGAIDGFIALPGGSRASMQLFFDEVMPALGS